MNLDLREAVLERDGRICQLCRVAPATEIDHIVPRSVGGDDSPENLRAACRWCNTRRTVAGDRGLTFGPLAARARMRREMLRLSRERLAAAAGVTVSTILRLEQGIGSPRLDTLTAIAKALDLPLTELLDGAAA